MEISPTPDRSRLGFENAAPKAFSFLENEYGFQLIGTDLYSVEYRRSDLWFAVLHDPLSYELDVSVRATGDRGLARPLGIGDFIRLSDPAAANNYRAFSATSHEALEHGLARLASDVRHYAASVLSGDVQALDRTVEARRQAAEEWSRSLSRKQENLEVEEAMKRQDWRRVIDIYEARTGELSATEQKRLDVARRRV